MRALRVWLFVASTSAVAFCSPDGVLEKVSTLQVDPTVVTNPEKVKDPAAANLVRFTLRSAVREARVLRRATHPSESTSFWTSSPHRTAK